MKITVVGTGYVGLVTGTCLAEVGNQVICVDIDAQKVAALKKGQSPIFEPGLEELIVRNISEDRLHFTTDLRQCLDSTMVFIAVGTPEGEDGSADLSYVLGVAGQIGEWAEQSTIVAVKSTVPVGTCDLVEERIQKTLAQRGKTFKIPVISNPEFLKEGAAIDDFMAPDRIVVGTNDHSLNPTIEDLYKPFILVEPSKLFITDRKSSELTKYGANAMLATRISFMNELARLCEKVGANIDNVRRGMGLDPRIGRRFLYAGPGYGGSCFPKDVQALIRSGEKNDVELLVLNAVNRANDEQKLYVSRKIEAHFGSTLRGSTIALWGLAFKPGTDDTRESPASTIIEYLSERGAKIHAHDPEANHSFSKHHAHIKSIEYFEHSMDTLKNADALVLVTEWPQYRRPDWSIIAEKMRQKVVFDFRNQYESKKLIDLGFAYYCVGRPDSHR